MGIWHMNMCIKTSTFYIRVPENSFQRKVSPLTAPERLPLNLEYSASSVFSPGVLGHGTLFWQCCLWWSLGPGGISLTSGGAGDWVTKVSHVGSQPCWCNWPPGHQDLSKLPWSRILYEHCHTSLMVEISAICMIPLGRRQL